MSGDTSRLARVAATLGVLVSVVSFALALASWGTASAATPSSFQLQGYVPETVSCAPDDSCTTAGSIPLARSNSYGGLMTTVVGGKAAALVTATLPANASPTDPWVGFGTEDCNFGVGIMCLPTGVIDVPPISNISCQSAGNCTAVGTYTDTAGNMDGVMFTETDGLWATGVQAQVAATVTNVPKGANTQLRFVSVQCASAGNCTAVANLSGFSFSGGAFPNGMWMLVGGETALVFTETNGVWSEGEELTPPVGAGTAPTYTSVASLSCPDAGDCVAVASSSNGPFVATESGGVWAPGTTVTPPSEPSGSWGMVLDAVACAQVGDCTVVGGLNVATTPSTDYPEPLAVSETNGVWSPATTINVPANAWPLTAGQLPDVGVESVLDLLSCPSAGNCTAAGDYADANGIPQGLFVNEIGGTWLTGVQAQQPANPGNYNTISLTQLSCAAAGGCAATGQETQVVVSNGGLGGIGASADTGLLFSETSGTWGPGSVPQLPANATQAAPAVVGAVSCSISSGCIAAGTYDAAASATVAAAAGGGSAAASGGMEPYVVRRTSSGWSRAVELTPPAATRAQVLATIRSLLSADRGAAASRGHKRFTGAVRSFTALEPGRIAVRWTARVGRSSVLVAQAGAKIAKPTTTKLHIRVTKAGAALLRASRTLRVTDRVVFTPVASAAVRASDSFKLASYR